MMGKYKFKDGSQFCWPPLLVGETDDQFRRRVLDDYETAINIIKEKLGEHDDEHQERHYKTHQRASKSDGGPSDYYDLPTGLKTFNDLLEWLAVDRWGSYALHMKDLMKGGFRFGVKDGTSVEYDCYKIIYSGCRLLVMAKGKDAVRKYLQKLLDDPQFK